MARRHHRAQCLKETDGKAVELESGDCLRNEDGEDDGHFGTEAKEVLPVYGAGGVREEMPTKETAPGVLFAHCRDCATA